MPDGQLESLETVLKALADRTRLRILRLLAGGEVRVCDIYASLRIPQPKASRHLAYLKRAGLLVSRKNGLWVHYRLAQPRDRVVASLLASVTHYLSHVSTTAKDRQRLEKATGCCATLPATELPAFACCSDVTLSTSQERGGTR